MRDATIWGSGAAYPRAGAHQEATPGQLRMEAVARSHALARLVEEAAETSRAVESCRTDPSWSGCAHDAFTTALDDLAAQLARAMAELRTAAESASSRDARQEVRR